MTDASCLPRTIKLPMHRTLSAKTELGQTKAVGLFLPLPKGKLVATQGWMGKGARQKKYLAAFHCASQDWIALVYWQIEIISGHFCFPGFPGGPVVKTLSFHRRGCGFDPWLGTACPESQPKKKSRARGDWSFPFPYSFKILVKRLFQRLEKLTDDS